MWKLCYLLIFHAVVSIRASDLKSAADSVADSVAHRILDNDNIDLAIINKTNRTYNFPYDLLSFNFLQHENESVLATGETDDNQLKGKVCMKNLTLCMEQDHDYVPTLRHLTNYFLQLTPAFDLSQYDGVSDECKQASRQFISDLKAHQLWAFAMYDATAKMPPGLLSGNINQLGDYDLCLWAKKPENDIYGKYCLAALQIESPRSAYLSAIHNRVHAHQAFKSKIDDPGHRVPRFSSINWGLCVPSQCSAKDIRIGFNKITNDILAHTDLEYKTKLEPEMCSTSKPPANINWGFIIASTFFILVALYAFASTVYDHFTPHDEQSEILVAFSLKKNIISMLNIKKSANDLEAVHGIRFINALMLLLSHKSMALLFLPYVNRTQMSEIIGQPWTVLGRAASLYTDPFIMLSATLTAYSLIGKLQRNQNISIFEEYASRLFRILPTFGALILFCTYVLPYLSGGPMWNIVVTHHADICKQNWWRNMLFIHNYFGFKDMCLTHTHHIGIDTQLFFLSPFLVLLVWKWPKQGSLGLLAVAIISTIMRYYATYTLKLSNYIHFGTSIEQLFNTADFMYILPPHRITVYIMGIFLAFILKYHHNITIGSKLIVIGHVIAIVSFLVSFVGPAFMGSIDYIYQPVHAAWYAAFAPIFWCLAFAWVVFISHHGIENAVTRFFCLPYFKIWTKISYTVYLTQFPIFFFNVGTTKHSESYDFIGKNVNLHEMATICLVSAVLTLLFETPFQNIKNVIFKQKKSVQVTTKKDD